MASWSGDFSTSTQSANGTEYTEVTCHSGRTLVNLSSNETFSNYLFDQSGGGHAEVMSQTSWNGTPPSSYHVANIGFHGTHPGGDAQMIFSCTSEATVENVYAGDGYVGYPVSGSWNSYPGCMRASPEHSGHLNFHRWYVANWVDNGFYCSPPGDPGPGGGSFYLENCYVDECNISAYRFGTQAEMVNCYGAHGSNGHRGIWGYAGGGHIDAYECSFRYGTTSISFSSYSTTTVDLHDSYYEGTNNSGMVSGGQLVDSAPEFIPEGCPTTALEAATGEGGGDEPISNPPENPDRSDYDNVLYVDVQDYPDYVTWEMEASGEIVHADYNDATRDGNDWVDESGDTWTAGSEAQNYNDAVFFNGDLIGLTSDPVDTGADFSLNGESVIPDNWSDGGGGGGGGGGDDPDDPSEPTDPARPEPGEPIGLVRMPYGDRLVDFPVFDTDDVEYDCWRVETQFGPGAIPVYPRGEASHPGYCIDVQDNIWAIEDFGYTEQIENTVPVNYDQITILDDFEGGISASWDEIVNVSNDDTAPAEGSELAQFGSNGDPSLVGAYADNTDLPAVPGAGQTPVSFWFRADDHHEAEVAIDLEADWNQTSGTALDEGYTFGSISEFTGLELYRVEGGTFEFVDVIDYDPGTDWTRAIWDYDDAGNHDIRVYNANDEFVDSIEWTDSSPLTGNGFRVAGAFAPSYVDLVHFTDTELVDDPGGGDDGGDTTDYTVENFESGSLSGWSSGRDSFEIDSDSLEGSYSARHNLSTVAGNLVSYPGDGLNYYPEQGDFITYYWKCNNTSDQSMSGSVIKRLQFGYEDGNNFYSASFELGDGAPQAHVSETSGGSWNILDIADAGHVPPDTWIRTEISWNDDGSIGAQWYIHETNESLVRWVSGTPTNHTVSSGGVRVNCTAYDSDFQFKVDNIYVQP